ncbi:hypothetical protein QE368_001609 [Asaia bogorensis NBRC 16594]|nr:hypothetical protein [Asaia bogorensis NBRC 16594]
MSGMRFQQHGVMANRVLPSIFLRYAIRFKETPLLPGCGAEPRFLLFPLQIRCQHGARVDQSVEIGLADGIQGQGGLFQRAVMVHGVMRDL